MYRPLHIDWFRRMGRSVPARPGTHVAAAVSRALRPWIVLLLLALTVQGCGGGSGAFSSQFPDNRPEQGRRMLSRLDQAASRPERAISVGVDAQQQLYAYDIEARRLLWKTPAQLRVPPIIAGHAVITHEGDSVVGRALSTGQTLFAVEDGGRTLAGGDGEAGLVAFTISGGIGPGAGSVVVAVRDGTVQWRRNLQFAAGTPAVRGDLVLVPWASQFLTALDADSGRELARLRIPKNVIGHALVEGEDVYIGQHAVYRISERLLMAPGSAHDSLRLDTTSLPGKPALLRNAYLPPQVLAPRSAWHKIGLAWAPAAVGAHAVQFTENQVYLIFYRYVFALDATSLAPRWVHQQASDIVGSRARHGELVIADEAGHIAGLAADSGALRWQVDTGARPTVVSLEVGKTPGTTQSTASRQTLYAQLLDLVRDPDDRLVPARLYALQALADRQTEAATISLLELCEDRGLTPSVRAPACEQLSRRQVGNAVVLEALKRHAGHLAQTTAPPLAPLARAAVQMKEPRAVPLLIAHLEHAHTPAEELAPLLQALGELGDPAAVAAILRFLELYHADAPDGPSVEAMGAAAQALVSLQGAAAEENLQPLTEAPFTSNGVRERILLALQRLRQQLESQAAPEAGRDEALAGDGEATEGDPEPSEEASPRETAPTRLTSALVAEALRPVESELSACLAEQPSPRGSAEVTLWVEDGLLIRVKVVPASLRACIEPLIRKQSFPRTLTVGRERVTHTVEASVLNRNVPSESDAGPSPDPA